MADAVASRSNPLVIATVLLMTFTQSTKMLKHFATRVGSKSSNGTVVARNSRVESGRPCPVTSGESTRTSHRPQAASAENVADSPGARGRSSSA